MPEVDPASGIPKSEIEKPSTVEKYNRLSEQKARSDQLRADLDSENGRTLINCIRDQLLNRVNHLIESDPESMALKKLITSMGLTLNIGEKAVDSLIKILIKR